MFMEFSFQFSVGLLLFFCVLRFIFFVGILHRISYSFNYAFFSVDICVFSVELASSCFFEFLCVWGPSVCPLHVEQLTRLCV